MQPDLTQAEVDALLGDEQRAVTTDDAVSPRDFRRPRRLGADQLGALSKAISSCLPKVESAVRAQGGCAYELSLFNLGETTRDELLSSLDEDGFFVQALAVNDLTGWCRWAPQDARQAIEAGLGCGSPTKSDAELTELERSLAGGLVMAMATGVGQALGLDLTQQANYTERRLLQASIDSAPKEDDQRLCVTLQVTAQSFQSELTLYLPGVTPVEDTTVTNATDSAALPADLPAHLDDVEVVLSAELATLELPLQDFLDLEEGDVIALGEGREMLARLVVDGRPAGRATWGRHGDRLAVRIEDLQIDSKD